MPTRITQVEKPTNAVDVQRTLFPYLFGAQEANALIAMLRSRRRCTQRMRRIHRVEPALHPGFGQSLTQRFPQMIQRAASPTLWSANQCRSPTQGGSGWEFLFPPRIESSK